MSQSRKLFTSLRYGLAFVCVAGAYAPSSADAQTYAFTTSESTFDTNYAATKISLTGTVTTRAGVAIPNATVSVLAWGAGAANAGKKATTNASGAFTITGLSRRSVVLKVSIANYYDEIIPVDLQRPLAETSVSIGTAKLQGKQTGRVRLMFAGDTMLGRRFTDADQDGIEGETGDLIKPATRAADAKALLTYMKDLTASANYTVVNLESPAITDTSTPHLYKDYIFYSHPETLAALPYAGIDAVDLANNHMFDYLTSGITNTMTNVSNAGLKWSGIGTSNDTADGTTIYETINGVPLSMLGFTNLVTSDSTNTNYDLVARDPTKAGSLQTTTTNLSNFFTAETGAGRFAIPMFHGGAEYSEYPTNLMRNLFTSSVSSGAGLVVAHHPHTVQGIGLVNKNGSPRFVLMSLGNFLFDQDIRETFTSYVAIVDVELSGSTYNIARLELVPFHLEGYVPKLLTGEWLTRVGRHVGHLSSHLPLTPSGNGTADGLYGATVFPSGYRILAFKDATQFTTSTSTETINAAVTNNATAPIKFARLAASDSLASIQTSTTATAEYGREILLTGDAEDLDVDGDYSEGSYWDQTTARYVENSVTRSGNGAIVLLRTSSNSGDASLFNSSLISIPNSAKLTITGYVRGDTAGTFTTRLRFYNSAGSVISTEVAYTRAAGTYGFEPFTASVTAPDAATDVRVYFDQSPPGKPASGTTEGRVFIDDVDLIRWEATNINASAGFNLPTPNNYAYVRFTGVASGVTTLGVTLGHKTFTAN